MGARPAEQLGAELVQLFHADRLKALAIIAGLWLITPLSWAYVGWTCLSPRAASSRVAYTAHLCLLAWTGAEVVFSVYYRYLAWRVQARQPWQPQDLAFLRQVLVRSLESDMSDDEALAYDPARAPSFVEPRLAEDDDRAVAFREQIRAWFLGSPFAALRRGNVRSWIIWSFFSQTPAEFYAIAGSAQRDFIEESLGYLEARAGRPIPEGTNERVKALRLTIDPVCARCRR